LDAWSLAYTIRESVPLPKYYYLAYTYKGFLTSHTSTQHKAHHTKAQAIYYYLDLLYVLKGFLDILI